MADLFGKRVKCISIFSILYAIYLLWKYEILWSISRKADFTEQCDKIALRLIVDLMLAFDATPNQ